MPSPKKACAHARRPPSLLFAVFLAGACAAAGCGGRPMSPADARDSARRHFELGKAAFYRDDFNAALTHFEAAQTLVFHPVTAGAIAECKVELGDLDGAILVLRELLDTEHAVVSQEAVENRIEELQWKKMSKRQARPR